MRVDSVMFQLYRSPEQEARYVKPAVFWKGRENPRRYHQAVSTSNYKPYSKPLQPKSRAVSETKTHRRPAEPRYLSPLVPRYACKRNVHQHCSKSERGGCRRAPAYLVSDHAPFIVIENHGHLPVTFVLASPDVLPSALSQRVNGHALPENSR